MKGTLLTSTFLWYWLLNAVIPTFEYVEEILKCDWSYKRYWVLLSRGTVYYAVQGGSNFWVCGWNPEVWLIQ